MNIEPSLAAAAAASSAAPGPSPVPDRSMPVAFLSHGSPMFAVQPGTTGPAFAQWGRELRERAGGRQLKAVVIMSPHWQTRQPMVGTAAQPATLHDFGGFPPALYALRYPAPGAPALAARVIEDRK